MKLKSPYAAAVMVKYLDRKEMGSGVLIDQETVLTNRHVVDLGLESKKETEIMRIQIKKGADDYQEYKIKQVIVSDDESDDLAIIKLEKPDEAGQKILDGVQPIALASEADR